MITLVAIIPAIILIIIIIFDIYVYSVYKHATFTTGTILRCEGALMTKSYGRYRYKKYWKYEVGFSTDNGNFIDTVSLRDGNLREGDCVTVKYTTNDNGTFLLDEIIPDRIKELGICFIIAIPLSVGIILFKLFAS